MTSPSKPAIRIVLTRHDGLGQINVDLEAFFAFSFGLAEDLEDLKARWIPWAAPRDSNSGNFRTADPK